MITYIRTQDNTDGSLTRDTKMGEMFIGTEKNYAGGND